MRFQAQKNKSSNATVELVSDNSGMEMPVFQFYHHDINSTRQLFVKTMHFIGHFAATLDYKCCRALIYSKNTFKNGKGYLGFFNIYLWDCIKYQSLLVFI